MGVNNRVEKLLNEVVKLNLNEFRGFINKFIKLPIVNDRLASRIEELSYMNSVKSTRIDMLEEKLKDARELIQRLRQVYK